ncbi:MAG: hypothetical protein Q7J46_02585 [Pseudomonas sp.]|nr:hypothetical protein [Pseudomonas sp.]
MSGAWLLPLASPKVALAQRNPTTIIKDDYAMNYRRAFVPGASYFFTLVTEQRRPWLADADNVELLRGAFRAVRATRPFEVAAMLAMRVWLVNTKD